MQSYEPTQLTQFAIEVDLQSVKQEGKSKKREQTNLVQPLFDPKDYAREHEQLCIADNQLDGNELWRYAVMANEVRMKILQKAKDEDDALSEAFEESKKTRKSNLVKLSRKYTRKLRGLENAKMNCDEEYENNGKKRNRRSLCKINLDEKIEILHLCLLGQMT